MPSSLRPARPIRAARLRWSAWCLPWLLLLAGPAAAQCPAGQPNTPGCIPPDAPGWRHNQAAEPSVPMPSKHRFQSHGAFAFDAQTGTVGVSNLARYAHGRRELAEQTALEDCRSKGGGEGCRIIAHYRNGCAGLMMGLAEGQAPVPHVGYGRTREKARQATEKVCRQHSAQCEPTWADCVGDVSL